MKGERARAGECRLVLPQRGGAFLPLKSPEVLDFLCFRVRIKRKNENVLYF